MKDWVLVEEDEDESTDGICEPHATRPRGTVQHRHRQAHTHTHTHSHTHTHTDQPKKKGSFELDHLQLPIKIPQHPRKALAVLACTTAAWLLVYHTQSSFVVACGLVCALTFSSRSHT